jgi:putative ABC transport system permease protein
MTFRYVLKELQHHHHRTLVNILGIAVGIALFVSINTIANAYQEAVSLPFRSIGADLVVQKAEKREVNAAQVPTLMQGIRLPFSNQLLAPEETLKLRSLEGVADTASSLLLWEFAQGGFRTIMGVDLAQPSLGPVKVKEWLAEGRFPQQAGEVVLEKHYAKFHHTKLGEALTIGQRTFTVVGLLAIKEGAQIASANIYLPLADARQLLGQDPAAVNVVYLHLQNPALQDQVKSRIGKVFPGLSVTSSDSSLELMGGVAKVSARFALLTSLVALLGAIALIIKTMLANLAARSNEIGILKAVGWTRKDIHKQLLGEALLQSLAGCLLGLIAGYLFAWSLGFVSIPATTPWQVNLLPAMAKESEATVPTVVQLHASISAGLIAASFLISITTGLLASYFMGRRTLKMKPADILRKL